MADTKSPLADLIASFERYKKYEDPFERFPKVPEFVIPFTPSDPVKDAAIIRPGGDSGDLEAALSEFAFGTLGTDPEVIERFRKQSYPGADLGLFSMILDQGVGPSRNILLVGVSRWYDSPYSFVLLHQRDPVASLSFWPKEDAIYIDQIQGVKGAQEKLNPLKWARYLIEVACIWAATNDISEVQIVPHHMSKNPTVQKCGKMNYDRPAHRNGFRIDPDSGLYVKKTDRRYVLGFNRKHFTS